MTNEKKDFYLAIIAIKENLMTSVGSPTIEKDQSEDVLYFSTTSGSLFVFNHDGQVYSLIFDKEIVALSRVSGIRNWFSSKMGLLSKWLYGAYTNEIVFVDIYKLMVLEMDEEEGDVVLGDKLEFDAKVSKSLNEKVLPMAIKIKSKVLEKVG